MSSTFLAVFKSLNPNNSHPPINYSRESRGFEKKKKEKKRKVFANVMCSCAYCGSVHNVGRTAAK